MHRHSPIRLLAVASALFWTLCANPPGLAHAAPADEDHYRLGLSFLQRGMHDYAAKELELYLETTPDAANSPTARYALATCLRHTKNLERAVKELDAALATERFDFEPDARFLRAQCLFDVAKYADAARECEEFAAKHPRHSLGDRAIILRAESLYRLGKFNDAAKVVGGGAEVLATSPQLPRARLIESMAMLAAGSYAKGAEAASLVRRADSPYRARAALVEAQCRRRLGEGDAALVLFEEAAHSDDASTASEAILGWSGTLRETGKPSDALRVLDRAPAPVVSAQQPAFELERARALFDAKEYAHALRLLSPLASTSTAATQPEATHLAARCELALGKPEPAMARLQSLVARGQDNPPAEVLLDLGLAQAQAKLCDQATSTLRKLLNGSPDRSLAPEALAALAQCQHMLAQPKDSLASCDTFLKDHAEHPSAGTIRFLRAHCLDQLDDPTSAAHAFADFVSRHASDPRVPTAQVSRGLALVRAKQVDAGVAILVEAAKSTSLSPADRTACLSALANAAIAASDWTSARRSLEQLRDLSRDESRSRELNFRIGLCLAQSGDHAAAADQFAIASSGAPDSPLVRQATLERGKSLLAGDRLDDARACLMSLVEANAADSLAREARSVLSEIATRQGRTGDALEFLVAGKVTEGDGAFNASWRLREGSLLLAAGRYDEAERALRSLASMPDLPAPIGAEARARLAICIARQARHDEAESECRKALADASLDGELARAVRFELARVCVGLKRPADATREFASLVGDAPSAIGAMASLELARLQLNATPGTSEHATLALAHLDTSAKFLRALPTLPGDIAEHESYLRGVCQARLGLVEASTSLSGFVERHAKSPLAPAARLLLGQELGKRGEWGRALPHFETAARLATDDETRERATLLLANAQSESQQWAEAEATFNEYLTKYPNSVMVFQARFGLGWARENAGKHESAIEAYRDVTARHQGSTAARAQFQIGECLFALARHEDAVREFAKVDALYAYPEWTAAALYESGRCLQTLGRADDARRTMSDVVTRFGDSKWAVIAREHLAGKSAVPTPGRTSAPSPRTTGSPAQSTSSDRR